VSVLWGRWAGGELAVSIDGGSSVGWVQAAKGRRAPLGGGGGLSPSCPFQTCRTPRAQRPPCLCAWGPCWPASTGGGVRVVRTEQGVGALPRGGQGATELREACALIWPLGSREYPPSLALPPSTHPHLQLEHKPTEIGALRQHQPLRGAAACAAPSPAAAGRARIRRRRRALGRRHRCRHGRLGRCHLAAAAAVVQQGDQGGGVAARGQGGGGGGPAVGASACGEGDWQGRWKGAGTQHAGRVIGRADGRAQARSMQGG
jgi:hypothetical protein